MARVNALKMQTMHTPPLPRGVLVFLNLRKILVSARFCGVCAR